MGCLNKKFFYLCDEYVLSFTLVSEYLLFFSHLYIALLDIDEVIIPLKFDNWSEMMEEVIIMSLKVKNETRNSWSFKTIYFFEKLQDQVSLKQFGKLLILV